MRLVNGYRRPPCLCGTILINKTFALKCHWVLYGYASVKLCY